MIKHSVLIVDDEKNVTTLLEKVLKKEGFNAYTANIATDALKIIDANQIDTVITDIKMPDMDGLELLKVIKEIDSSINVIIITAFATLDTAIEALKKGARDYITKPFNLDDIIDSVKKITELSDSSYFENDNTLKPNDTVDNYFITKSENMKNLMKLIRQVSDTKATIMLYGQTGTGKELAAEVIHNLSPRRDKPFLKVNCTAIPDSLLESELFGFEKGAFTGASYTKPGKFELADGGTIFLDEIGDISSAMQVKLLRVLQEREFEHLGGIKTIKVDVRIITATNKNIEEMVKKGEFREDLYYRLNVIPIKLPQLSDRKEDIPDLVDHFLLRSSFISGRPPKKVSKEVLKKLIEYSWPGNIRELENIIERCVVITSNNEIEISDLPDYIKNYNAREDISCNQRLDNAVDTAEINAIIKALSKCKNNRTMASEMLGISRRSLQRKIIKYGIDI